MIYLPQSSITDRYIDMQMRANAIDAQRIRWKCK